MHSPLNTALAVLLGWTLSVLPSASAELEVPVGLGYLDFVDGGRLSVLLLELDADEDRLLLRQAHLREPLEVDVRGLRQFTSAGRPPAVRPATWRVELANGEIFRGDHLRLDGNTLQLDAFCAGAVTLPRGLLRKIAHAVAADVLLEGWGDVGEWTVSGPAPSVARDTLTLRGASTISRALERMPSALRIDFTVHPESDPRFGLQIRLFTHSADSTAGTGQYGMSYLFRRHFRHEFTVRNPSGSGGDWRGSVATPFEGTPDKPISYTLLCGREGGVVQVYRDGQGIAEWKDVAGLGKPGRHIAFDCTEGSGVKLSSLSVRAWDGKPLGAGAATAPEPESGQTLRMAGGESVSGVLEGIGPAGARVDTGFGTLDIPAERIASVMFHRPDEAPTSPPGAVRLHVHDGSVFLLGSARLADGVVSGVSPSAGVLRIPLAEMRMAEWKLDAPEVPAGPGALGWLEFVNGDRLAAEPIHVDPETDTLVARHAPTRPPLRMKLGGLVRHVAVSGRSPLARASAWRVELTGGEVFRGELEGMDQQAIRLDSWYAGPLKLSRARVRSATHAPPDACIVEGPGPLEQWNVLQGQPPVTAGESLVLKSAVHIAREVGELPDLLRMDIETEWTRNAHMNLLLFAGDSSQDVSLSTGAMVLRMVDRAFLGLRPPGAPGMGGGAYTANMPMARSGAERRARYTFLYDRDAGVMLVYLDGQRVAEWTGIPPPNPAARFVTIQKLMDHHGDITVKAFSISRWDGVPLDGEAQRAAAPNEKDVLTLLNRDEVVGQLASLSRDGATIHTRHGALDIPLERIVTWRAGGDRPRQADPNGSLRLTLYDGSLCLLERFRLADGFFEGDSPGAGPLRIPRPAVKVFERSGAANAPEARR